MPQAWLARGGEARKSFKTLLYGLAGDMSTRRVRAILLTPLPSPSQWRIASPTC
jgi:hypothetical protein